MARPVTPKVTSRSASGFAVAPWRIQPCGSIDSSSRQDLCNGAMSTAWPRAVQQWRDRVQVSPHPAMPPLLLVECQHMQACIVSRLQSKIQIRIQGVWRVLPDVHLPMQQLTCRVAKLTPRLSFAMLQVKIEGGRLVLSDLHLPMQQLWDAAPRYQVPCLKVDLEVSGGGACYVYRICNTASEVSNIIMSHDQFIVECPNTCSCAAARPGGWSTCGPSPLHP